MSESETPLERKRLAPVINGAVPSDEGVKPAAADKRHAGDSMVPGKPQRPRSHSPETPTNVDADTSGGAALSSEELENTRRLLAQLRTALRALVSEGNPPKSWRNPFDGLRRFWVQESRFEKMVGKYASLLHCLELPCGLIYTEMALFGIEALRTRRYGISKSVFAEVQYRTSASAALVWVMKGISCFVAGLLALLLVAIGASIKSYGVPGAASAIVALFNNPLGSPEGIAVAAVAGCLGSVVSLLLRLAEFDCTKGKSKEFMFLYGLTLPIVGVIFASVVASFVGTIIKPDPSVQVYIVIGFLSGFSERFTRNLLHIAESRFGVPDRDVRKR